MNKSIFDMWHPFLIVKPLAGSDEVSIYCADCGLKTKIASTSYDELLSGAGFVLAFVAGVYEVYTKRTV